MTKLETLYSTIENLHDLGLSIGEDLQQNIEKLETELIQNEVIPQLQRSMEPIMRQVRNKVVLVVDWDPSQSELVISKSRRGRIVVSNSDMVLYRSANNPRPQVDPDKPKIQRTTKNPISVLRVTLPDGRVWVDKIAENTFIRTLEYFGLSRVQQLGLEVGGQPLVSRTIEARRQKITPDGYYISVNTSTQQKRSLLEKVARALGVKLKIVVLERSKA